MSLPVIYLAFANDPNSPLAALTREHDSIRELLMDGVNNQYFQLYPEPFATIEKVASGLSSFKDRVHIFHFGGHAGGRQLILTDQEANSDGIASLLAMQKNLKLVFLNGCSTKGQVRLLLDIGVPAVIATSVPINDEKAVNFARQFYLALAKKHSIEEAFRQASAFNQASGMDAPQVHRGIDIDGVEAGKETLPWGLYTQEKSVEALHWKLPAESHKEIVIQGASSRYNTSHAPVNEHLTQVMLDTLAQYDRKLRYTKTDMEEGEDIDIREVRLDIMNSLPAPIGEQIRRLFAADPESQAAKMDQVSEERLSQLVKTYNTITELLAYIMMAQLWDERHRNPETAIPPNCLSQLQAYFSLQAQDLKTYNFIPLIRSIRLFFDSQQISYFIEEIKGLKEQLTEGSLFMAALGFMEQMKEKLYNNGQGIPSGEIEDFCVQAEEQLALIFRHLAFLAKYKLATIKNIDLIKRRHSPPQYRHFLVQLDKVTAGYLDQEKTFEQFTDNQSVIILKSNKDVAEYLNLSPFVIDENAFTGDDKSKLFFFTHYDRATETYHYKFAYMEEDRLQANARQFTELSEQFSHFIHTIFGKSINDL